MSSSSSSSLPPPSPSAERMMAKKRRAAEALLAWRALPDCESSLLSSGPGPLPKRPRSDPDGGKDYRGSKRKRAAGAAEEDAQQPLKDEEGEVNGKRRAVPKGSGTQKESAKLPGLLLEENPPRRRRQHRAGGMDEESAEGDAKSSHALRPPESEEDVWCYNSFQYWRSPLPPIDLTDILDLEKDDSEMRNVGNIGFSEMET